MPDPGPIGWAGEDHNDTWGRLIMRTQRCPKCSQPMEEGFIVDYTHGGQTQAHWVEGPPQRSFWTGLTLRGRVRRDVATFCCTKCGFLESYAKPEEG